MRDSRERGILDIDSHLLHPGVPVEARADQLTVFGPGVERVRSAVRAAEAFAVPHECEQVLLLAVGNRKLPAGEEDYRIKARERCGIKLSNILGGGHFQAPAARFRYGPHRLNRNRQRIVPESCGMREIQQAPRLCRYKAGRGGEHPNHPCEPHTYSYRNTSAGAIRVALYAG